MKNIFRFIGTVLLIGLLIVLFSEVNIDDKKTKENSVLNVSKIYNKESSIKQPDLQGYQLIISNPAKDVFVYGKKIDSQPYFNKVLVKTSTTQREFNWKATTKNPQLMFADLTGGGKENIAIVFVTAYGTGVYESQIHVLNQSLTNEFPVQDPVLSVKRLVTSKIQGDEIVFAAGGKEYRVKPQVGSGGISSFYRNLQYGSVVTYNVENNGLRATVSVQGNSNIFGDFILDYSYEGGKLTPRVTDFKKL